MITTSLEKIYRRIDLYVTDPNFLNLDEFEQEELKYEYIQDALGDPRIRRIFKTISLNESEIKYALRHPVDDYSDEAYVIRLLTISCVISWLRPQVESVINIAPFVGGKEEKVLLNNHATTIARLKDLEKEKQAIIRDRNYMYNDYVGEAVDEYEL